MYDSQPVNEYHITPDGYLRKSGQIVDVSLNAEGPIDLTVIGSMEDANAEAAKRYLRVAQTPLQTVGVGQG
jgi:hypothetical protein